MSYVTASRPLRSSYKIVGKILDSLGERLYDYLDDNRMTYPNYRKGPWILFHHIPDCSVHTHACVYYSNIYITIVGKNHADVAQKIKESFEKNGLENIEGKPLERPIETTRRRP